MIDARKLIESATREAELEDFGEDSWREGFDRLVTSLNAEADLTPLGTKVTLYRLRTLLRNRLRVEDWYRAHPELDKERIVAPLFIIGLPRTGTTALSNLIAADPQIRSLRLWESSDPIPPPSEESQDSDPRIARTQAGLDAMDQMYPRMKALYPQSAAGPTECQDLLGMAFRTIHFDGMARVPGYISWVLDAEPGPAYAYHARVLKLLQSRCSPKLWHLKTPVHMFAMDSLDAVYPDARFIWTHRDPAEVIGSVCSLITYLRAMTSERSDGAELATQQVELWVEGLRRAIAFRDSVGEDRFADVHNQDLTKDGIGAVRAVYESLGLTLSGEAEIAMRSYLDANPRGGHGKHEFALSDYGLNESELRGRFAFYAERFGVA